MASRQASEKNAYDPSVLGALAYLLGIVSGIILYFAVPRDKFVRFHAVQSMLATVAAVVISFILSVISIPLAFIPFLGWFLLAVLHMVWWLILVVGWLLLMYKALKGEKYRLPIVGRMADEHSK